MVTILRMMIRHHLLVLDDPGDMVEVPPHPHPHPQLPVNALSGVDQDARVDEVEVPGVWEDVFAGVVSIGDVVG